MVYKEKILISRKLHNRLRRAINWKIGDKISRRFNEDEKHTETVRFENGYEIDIKCCGVQMDENGRNNGAWCEAVLFNERGFQESFSDVSDEFVGDWQLQDTSGNVYIVSVMVDK